MQLAVVTPCHAKKVGRSMLTQRCSLLAAGMPSRMPHLAFAVQFDKLKVQQFLSKLSR
jgi:hypothetical protein